VRVSLVAEAVKGTCAVCGAGSVPVLPFSLIFDGQAGDAEPLCASCLFTAGGIRVDVPLQSLTPEPLGRRKGLKKAKKTSQKQEVDIAAELGGTTQPGSGNQRGAKGDVRKKGELRVEAKFTTARSFSLKLDELYKISGECGLGERPVFVIDFLEPGTRKPKDRFAVIHFEDLKELLNASGQHR